MEENILPLTDVAPEKELTLVSIEGGHGFSRRLTDMGLKKGANFKLLHNDRPGPCIIALGNTRLVLGHGMAHKIMVKEKKA